MEVVGSPRRFDGNVATWEPCEPLMNVFREKVILTEREMQKSKLVALSKPITKFLAQYAHCAQPMVVHVIKHLLLG